MQTPNEKEQTMKTLNTNPQTLVLISMLFCSFGLMAKVQAVSPAPDGGYPGGNTAEGQSALFSLTTGGFNTAAGFLSLRSDATGGFNTAIGAGTLLANTADQNTATGAGALLSNTTGAGNTANGAFALFSNTEGDDNTALGDSALFYNTTGFDNTANGILALLENTTGNRNTAIGYQALDFNTIGSNNIALGAFAGAALNTGDNNIDIGSGGVVGESNTIRIGERGVQEVTVIAGISGVTLVGGVPVLVGTDGQLGTASSSRRFKKEIQPMGNASESVLGLKPVTFHYKSDSKNMPQFGLIAEEVAEVNPNLVVRDEKGDIYTVRYEAVNAMLLNEFLKEHRKVEQQQATIAKLSSTVAEQQKGFAKQAEQIQGLIAGLQKVTAQIEAIKPRPEVVLNDP